MNGETFNSKSEQNVQYSLQCNDIDGCKLVKTDTTQDVQTISNKTENNLDDSFNEVLKETIKSKRGFGKRKNKDQGTSNGGQCACGR